MPLDLAHHGRIETAPFSHLSLAPASRLPQLFNLLTECHVEKIFTA
ncbi:MAG: hypothetical protein LC647_10795 [Beggiatoa sp.]|nr:hypothetical protein [Beggiatoa sp.]